MHRLSISRTFLALSALAAVALTGCYTQLATRGHGSADPAYSQGYPQSGSVPADSLDGDSSLANARAPEADTLAPGKGAPTVIVNNYYDDRFSYRGYAGWEWDYPALSFGFYSSRYDRYSRPWWWDHPGYSRRPRHSHHHHGYSGHHDYRPPRPTTPAAPSGPYKSDKRLFDPEPSYVPLRKGRRADPPATTPPAHTTPPASKTSSQEETSQSGDGGSGSSSGSGSQEARPSRDESRQNNSGSDYPALRKGKRR